MDDGGQYVVTIPISVLRLNCQITANRLTDLYDTYSFNIQSSQADIDRFKNKAKIYLEDSMFYATSTSKLNRHFIQVAND